MDCSLLVFVPLITLPTIYKDIAYKAWPLALIPSINIVLIIFIVIIIGMPGFNYPVPFLEYSHYNQTKILQ